MSDDLDTGCRGYCTGAAVDVLVRWEVATVVVSVLWVLGTLEVRTGFLSRHLNMKKMQSGSPTNRRMKGMPIERAMIKSKCSVG